MRSGGVSKLARCRWRNDIVLIRTPITISHTTNNTANPQPSNIVNIHETYVKKINNCLMTKFDEGEEGIGMLTFKALIISKRRHLTRV
eukprot:scaffold23950_cov56-Attheya_sp.AAC.4